MNAILSDFKLKTLKTTDFICYIINFKLYAIITLSTKVVINIQVLIKS